MTERTLKGWTDLAHTEPTKGTEWREVRRIKSNKRGCWNSNERKVEVWKRPGTKLKRWCTNSEMYHKAESSYFLNVSTLLFPNILQMLWPYFRGYHYHHNSKHMEVKEQEREVTEWAEILEASEEEEEGQWWKPKTHENHLTLTHWQMTLWTPHSGGLSFLLGILLLGGLIGFCLSSETGMIRWI